jgi:O6-methylguanine-DNA--protein-cysteine methyltransferase
MDVINTDTSARSVQVARSKSAAISNEIAFSIGESALGKVLVARSAVGVCAILIGSDTDELSSDLAKRFPDSRLVADEQQLRDDLSKIVRFIDKPSEGLDLPLDMRHGTPFQRRVWDALLAIPCGARVTYAALAHRNRHAERGPCGCQRLRSQRDRSGHSLPPGRPERRHPVGLSLGRGAQAAADQ